MLRYAADDPLWSARFRVELGRILLYEGQSADASTQLSYPLPSGSLGEMVVRKNLLLSIAKSRLGEDDYCDQLVAGVLKSHPEGALLAETMATQGSIALYRGDIEAAQQFFDQALNQALLSSDTFLETQLLINLGLIAMQQEHYNDAMGLLNRASVLAESMGAKLALEKARLNLGWIYYQIGDLAKAKESMQLAEAQAKSLGSRLDESVALTNIGMIQARNGDEAAALVSYHHALSLAEALRNQEKIGGAHVALAYLLLHTDLTAADFHIREASKIYETRKNGIEGQEVSLLASMLLVQQGKKEEASTKLLGLEKQAKDAPWLRWQAQNTLAGLYAETGDSAAAATWFERAIDTFHRQRDSVGNIEMQLPFFENGSDLYLSYMEYLIRQHRTDQALAVLDRSRAESLAEGLRREATGAQGVLSPRAVAERLGATILVYCLRPGRSHLWAIDKQREAFVDLPGSEAILPLVERHRRAILASKDLLAQQEDSTATALYEALVRPVATMVKPGERVFLVPDNGLSGLNFETLVVPGANPHYWIEDVSVTNARSLRLLAARRGDEPAQPATKRKMLLIGDPVYRPEEYPPLSNAAAEMAGVSSHFAPDQRTVMLGAAASPEAYAGSAAGRYGYIHFVAHATADAINPLDSAVILSHQADSAAPNKLYAADILKQPLDAELVTISSCYGSGVRNYTGEGVVGLVWAFLRAGAHSVIGALWEVSDVSTPRLMDAMYGELLRGTPPDEALRSAKLAMLRDPGVFRKPLYWASFQLYAGR